MGALICWSVKEDLRDDFGVLVREVEGEGLLKNREFALFLLDLFPPWLARLLERPDLPFEGVFGGVDSRCRGRAWVRCKASTSSGLKLTVVFPFSLALRNFSLAEPTRSPCL